MALCAQMMRLDLETDPMSENHELTFPYQGASMRGTFRPGDLLTVTPITLQDLRRGDVVAFHQSSSLIVRRQIVHRVDACTCKGVITRGDQCRVADQTVVTSGDLIGRVSAVERDGKTRPVLGGWRGRIWASALRLWRRVAPVVGWPYRLMRNWGLARALWYPSLASIHIETEAGPIVKYVHRNRTVARWWPTEGRFWCRKPYDLVVSQADANAQSYDIIAD